MDKILVPFHGSNLFVFGCAGQPHVAMKPIVEGMGLDWGGQHKRLTSDARRWGISITEIPTASGGQETICMPLRKLPGWLMTIQASRVKDVEAAAKVRLYQSECDDVLWKYWTEGHVEHPELATTVVDYAIDRAGLRAPETWTQDLAHKIEQTRGYAKGTYEMVKSALGRISAASSPQSTKDLTSTLNALARTIKDPAERQAAAHKLFPDVIPAPFRVVRPAAGVQQPLPGL